MVNSIVQAPKSWGVLTEMSSQVFPRTHKNNGRRRISCILYTSATDLKQYDVVRKKFQSTFSFIDTSILSSATTRSRNYGEHRETNYEEQNYGELGRNTLCIIQIRILGKLRSNFTVPYFFESSLMKVRTNTKSTFKKKSRFKTRFCKPGNVCHDTNK